MGTGTRGYQWTRGFPGIRAGTAVATIAAMQQLRYAARQLRLSPGFTLVAVLTLVLGMGANSAFFSVLYGVVLQAAAVSRGRQARARAEHRRRVRRPTGARCRARSSWTIEPASGHSRGLPRPSGVAPPSISDGGAERVKVSNVTANIFTVLGVAPARGRVFDTTAEQGPARAEAVISDEFWRVQLGGADDVLGRTVRLNGVDQTIVGILPANFSYPEPGVAAWLPLDLGPRASRIAATTTSPSSAA